MRVELQLVPTIVFAGVMLCWFVFAAAFVSRAKVPKAPESRRDRRSLIGMALQSLGYVLVWTAPRPFFTQFVPLPFALEIVLAMCTLALAAASVWLILTAVQTLGKQWSYTARLVEEHNLITSGPYSRVRNPIYAGMLGMLLATGLAAGRWITLLAALAVFLLGTIIRVRSEERLLRQKFGAEFEDYARRAPALFPRIDWSDTRLRGSGRANMS